MLEIVVPAKRCIALRFPASNEVAEQNCSPTTIHCADPAVIPGEERRNELSASRSPYPRHSSSSPERRTKLLYLSMSECFTNAISISVPAEVLLNTSNRYDISLK